MRSEKMDDVSKQKKTTAKTKTKTINGVVEIWK